jgi:ribosomal-protein-alanine N-acetyltransferase
MFWWLWWQRSKPSYFVTEASEDDLVALAEIHEASFPHGWDADTLHGMLRGGMAGLVVRREGDSEPLGFVLVRTTGKEAEIITIAVAPAARGKGAGCALMDDAIRRLQRDRVERLFLEVSERNSAALALYRALGFRKVGERKAYYASHVEGDKSAVGHTSSPPLNAPPSALVMELVLR